MSNFQFGLETMNTLNADDFVSINKPGEYLHRVLAGGRIIESVFYPTLVFDEAEQQLKQGWRVIKKDTANGSPILDKLMAIDLAIKRQNSNPVEQKSIRSQFASTKKWIYLVFDRTSSDPEITLKIAQYPYSVAKELNNKQGKLSVDDKTMLRYGPTFIWDAIITHEYDKNKKGADYSKHSYSVEVDPNSNFNGKFPAIILDTNKYPNPIEVLDDKTKSLIFSKDEWDAIDGSEIKMEEVLKPHTEEEIIELLTVKQPIFFEATRDNVPLFPHTEIFKEEMVKQGLNALISNIQVNTGIPPAITGNETPKEEPKEELKISLGAPANQERKEIVIEKTEAQINKDIKLKSETPPVLSEDKVDDNVLDIITQKLKEKNDNNSNSNSKPTEENTTGKIVLNLDGK